MKMQIVAYDRGPLKISDTIKKEEINFENVEVKISMLLKYNTDGGFLGAQMTINFVKDGGADIAEIGMMFTTYVEGWNEFVQTKPNEDEIIAFLKENGVFFGGILTATNAVVMERCVGTIADRFFVPCTMDVDEFVANAVKILKEEE